MDRRTSLYLYAWRNHIDVDYFPMQTAEAFSVPIGGTCAIALDPTKIRSEADEAVKLSHELGHSTAVFTTNTRRLMSAPSTRTRQTPGRCTA